MQTILFKEESKMKDDGIKAIVTSLIASVVCVVSSISMAALLVAIFKVSA
jgi:hypothetical protein